MWYPAIVYVSLQVPYNKDKGTAMEVSYKKLWKILIDRDMKKKDLAEKANLSNYTINKMTRGDNVTTDTLVKICTVLNCSFDDIMEMVPDEKS